MSNFKKERVLTASTRIPLASVLPIVIWFGLGSTGVIVTVGTDFGSSVVRLWETLTGAVFVAPARPVRIERANRVRMERLFIKRL